MADVSDRVALPIQVHEFLLSCAGRIDDDALTDTRELLAVAELDRAIELLTGSLVAGRISITSSERDTLARLIGAVRSSETLLERIVIDDSARLPRHRFTVGADDRPQPGGRRRGRGRPRGRGAARHPVGVLRVADHPGRRDLPARCRSG